MNDAAGALQGSSRRPTSGASEHRPRIVVLGAGYAGAYAARTLARRLPRLGAQLCVIDRHNYLVVTPLLVEAGTGSLEPRHTIVPIRDFLPRGDFRMAEVTGVDLAEQHVTYRMSGDDHDRVMRWDHLVIALGGVTRMPDLPGVRTHCFQMKSLSDAVALRDHIIESLERADAEDDRDARRALQHVVVVGGNFTGVEVAGEFDEFIREAARRYPNVDPNDCRMTLVEMTDTILRALGEDLSAFALKHLRKRGVDVKLETTIESVTADSVALSTGETLRSRTVIWCAGIEPNPLIARIDVPRDERGYIRCDRDLRVSGFPNVWAVGDCAVNTDAQGNAYPATAQHAVREGTHLARNIEAALSGRETTPCDLKNLGSLAAIGCRTGVARVFGLRLSGFAAWWLWRTVYLLKMPRLGRKVRVALDWTIDLLFRRDYVQLGVHRSPLPEARRSESDEEASAN